MLKFYKELHRDVHYHLQVLTYSRSILLTGLIVAVEEATVGGHDGGKNGVGIHVCLRMISWVCQKHAKDCRNTERRPYRDSVETVASPPVLLFGQQ